MRNICALRFRFVAIDMSRGDKQCVGLGDESACRLIKAIRPVDFPFLLRHLDLGQYFHGTGLDVLWAVPKGVVDRDREPDGTDGVDPARESIAPPGVRLNTQHADVRTGSKRVIQRIAE